MSLAGDGRLLVDQKETRWLVACLWGPCCLWWLEVREQIWEMCWHRATLEDPEWDKKWKGVAHMGSLLGGKPGNSHWKKHAFDWQLQAVQSTASFRLHCLLADLEYLHIT